MDGERRPGGNIPHLRKLSDRALPVAWITVLGREHALRAVADVVPLRAQCDLERAHLGSRVDRGDVEGERVEPPAGEGGIRRPEVAVPGLVLRAGERDVEPDLDDP